MADYDIIINAHMQGFLKKEVQGLSEEMRNLYTMVDRVNDQTKNYNRAQKSLNAALGIGSDGQRVYAKTTMDAARNAAVLKNNLKLVQRQVHEVNQQFGKDRIAGAIRRATGRATEFDKTLRSASRNLQNIQKASRAIRFTSAIRDSQSLAKNFLNMGKNLQYVGRNLTIGLTLPLVQFFRFGLDSFKRLETEVIRFNKIIGQSTLDTYEQQEAVIYRLEKEIVEGFDEAILVKKFERVGTAAEALVRDLDNITYKYGVARELVQGIAADFATIGLTDTRVLADLTELTAAIEKVGDVDITTSREFIQALFLGAVNTQNFNEELRNNLSTVEQYRLAVDQVRGTLALFNTIENNTVVTMQKLSKAVPEMIAVTNLYGLTTAEAAAAFAPMIAAGFEVGASGNSIKVSLQRLVAPAKQNREILNELAQTVTDFNFEVGVGVDSVAELARAFVALENAKGMQGALELYARLFGVRQGSRMLTAFVELSRFQEDLANSASEAYNIANTIVDNVNKAVIESGFEAELRNALGGGLFTATDIATIGQIARVAGDEYAMAFNEGGTGLYKAITDGQAAAVNELKEGLEGTGDVLDGITSQAGKIILAQAQGIAESGSLLEEELEKALQSPAVKLARAKETFKGISRELIPPLVDALESLTPTIKRLADFIKNMPQGLKTLISAGLLITMVFGPLVTVFSNLTQGIGLLAGGLFRVIGSISKFSLLGRGGMSIAADTLAGVKNLDKFGSKLSRISEDAYFFKGTKRQFNRALNRSVTGSAQSGAAESDMRRLLRLQALYDAYNKKLGKTQVAQAGQAQSNVVLSKSQQRQILAINQVGIALDALKVQIIQVTGLLNGQSGVIPTLISLVKDLKVSYSDLGKSINGTAMALAGKGGKGGLNGKMRTFAVAATNAGTGASKLTASLGQLMRQEAAMVASITAVASAMQLQADATKEKNLAMGKGATSLSSKVTALAKAEGKLAGPAAAAAAAMHKQANAIERMVLALGSLNASQLSTLAAMGAGPAVVPAGAGAGPSKGAAPAPVAPRAPPKAKPPKATPAPAPAPVATPKPKATPKPRVVIPTPAATSIPASPALAAKAAGNLNASLQKQVLEAFAKAGRTPAPEVLYALRNMDLAAATGGKALNARGLASLVKAIEGGVLTSLPGGKGFQTATGSGIAAVLSKEIGKFLSGLEAFAIGQAAAERGTVYGPRVKTQDAPSRFETPPQVRKVVQRSNAGMSALASRATDPRTMAASEAYRKGMKILGNRTKEIDKRMSVQRDIMRKSNVALTSAQRNMEKIAQSSMRQRAMQDKVKQRLMRERGFSSTFIRQQEDLMRHTDEELRALKKKKLITQEQIAQHHRFLAIREAAVKAEMASNAEYLAADKARTAALAQQQAAERKFNRLQRVRTGLTSLETDLKRTIGPGTDAYRRGVTTPVTGLRSIRAITANAESVGMMTRANAPVQTFMKRLPDTFNRILLNEANAYKSQLERRVAKMPGSSQFKAAVVQKALARYNLEVQRTLSLLTQGIIQDASARGLTGAKAASYIRGRIKSEAIPRAVMAGRNIPMISGGAGRGTLLQGILGKYGLNVKVYEERILNDLNNQVEVVKRQLAASTVDEEKTRLRRKLNQINSLIKIYNREMTEPQIKALNESRASSKASVQRAVNAVRRVAKKGGDFNRTMQLSYLQVRKQLENGTGLISQNSKAAILRVMQMVNSSLDFLDETGDIAQELAAVMNAAEDPLQAAVAEVAAEAAAASAAAVNSVNDVGDDFEQLSLSLTTGSRTICAGLEGSTKAVVQAVPVVIKSVQDVQDDMDALAIASGVLSESVGAAVDQTVVEAAAATVAATDAINDIDPMKLGIAFEAMLGGVNKATAEAEIEVLTTSRVIKDALKQFGDDFKKIGSLAAVLLGPLKVAATFAISKIMSGGASSISLLNSIGNWFASVGAAAKTKMASSKRITSLRGGLMAASNWGANLAKAVGREAKDFVTGVSSGAFSGIKWAFKKIPGSQGIASGVKKAAGAVSVPSMSKIRDAINISGIMSGSVLTTEWSNIAREIKKIGIEFKPIAKISLKGLSFIGKTIASETWFVLKFAGKNIAEYGRQIKTTVFTWASEVNQSRKLLQARVGAGVRAQLARFGAAFDNFYNSTNENLRMAGESIKSTAKNVYASGKAGLQSLRARGTGLMGDIRLFFGSVGEGVYNDSSVGIQQTTGSVISTSQSFRAKLAERRAALGGSLAKFGRAVVMAMTDPSMALANLQLMIGASIVKNKPRYEAAKAKVISAMASARKATLSALKQGWEFVFTPIAIAALTVGRDLRVRGARVLSSISFAATSFADAGVRIARFMLEPANLALVVGLKLDAIRTKVVGSATASMAKFRAASVKVIQFITDPASIFLAISVQYDKVRGRIVNKIKIARAKYGAGARKILEFIENPGSLFFAMSVSLDKIRARYNAKLAAVRGKQIAAYIKAVGVIESIGNAASRFVLLTSVRAANSIAFASMAFDKFLQNLRLASRRVAVASIVAGLKAIQNIKQLPGQIKAAAVKAGRALRQYGKSSLEFLSSTWRSFRESAVTAWKNSESIRNAGKQTLKSVVFSGARITKSVGRIGFSFAKIAAGVAVASAKLSLQVGKTLGMVGTALVTARSTARVSQMQAAAQQAGTKLGGGTVFRTAFSESIAGTKGMITGGWEGVVSAQKGILNTAKTLGKTVLTTMLNATKLMGSLVKAPIQIASGIVQAMMKNLGGIFEIGKAIGNVFKNVVKLATDLVKGLMTAASQLAKTVLSTVTTIGKSMFSVLKSVTKFLVLGITFGPLILGAAALGVAIKRLATSFKAEGDETENAARLKERFKTALKGLKDAVVALLRPFAEAFNAMFGLNDEADKGANAFNTLAAVVLSVIERIGGYLKAVSESDSFKRFAEKAVGAMKQVIEVAKAVFNGIKSYIKGDSEEASNFFGQAFARMQYYGLSLASVIAPIWGGLIKFMLERLQQLLNGAIPAFLKIVEFLANNFGPPFVKIIATIVQKALDILFKLPEYLPDIIFAMLEGWAKFSVWSATIARNLVIKMLNILVNLVPGFGKIVGEMIAALLRFLDAAAQKVGSWIKWLDPTYYASKVGEFSAGAVGIGVDLGDGLANGVLTGLGKGLGGLGDLIDGAVDYDWNDNDFTNFFDGIFNSAIDASSASGDIAQDALTSIFDSDTVKGWKESMSNSIRDGLSGSKDAISGFVEEMLYGSKDDIPGPIQEMNGALQGGLMGLLENLDLPEWEGSDAQASMNALFDKLGPEIDKRIGDFVENVEDKKQQIRDSFQEKFGVAFEAVPGAERASDTMEDIRKTAADIGRAYANAINAGGDELTDMADDVGKAVEDALKDATQRFVDTVVDILGNAISDLKSDLTDLLGDQRDSALQYFDDQISAIEALEKAEEELFRKQEQIESDRQRNRDRALQKENYRRNRSLAIYEGRIDDARQLDLEERRSSEDFAQETQKITKDRVREEQSRQRDIVKEILKRQKDDAKQTFDDIIENFEDFVENIGKYGTYNQEELEQQFAEIREAAKNASIDITDSFEDYYKQIPDLIADYTDPTVGFFSESLNAIVEEARKVFGIQYGEGSDTLLGVTAMMLSTYNNKFEGGLGEAEDTFVNSFDKIVNVVLKKSLDEIDTRLEEFDPATIFEEALVEANTIMQREFAKMIDSHNSLVDSIAAGMDQLTIDLVTSMADIQNAAGSASNSIRDIGSAIDDVKDGLEDDIPTMSGYLARARQDAEDAMAAFDAARAARAEMYNPYNPAMQAATGVYRGYGGSIPSYGMGGKIKKYANGGYPVPGFGSTPVPAILHGGEFVINSKAVSNIGMAALVGLNNLKFKNMRMPSSAPMAVTSSTSTTNIYVDNFIGQDEWFNSMMKEYNVKVHRRNQKSAGLESRNISTYTGLGRGM